MSKAILQLGTLTCPSCMTKIEKAVAKQPGVETVKVLFNASKVKASFDETTTSADQLSQVVTGLGYDVESVKVK
ncbi:heavy-metal-associated domain-containing protein [Lactiplantibacillus mudanjiangensis]|uniref:Copper resistance protein CopZ [Lactobacillus sp.] n=1 Tax=Lactiplantibacillus mudanjiangensis TaxID=1296538 RepID=A0A660DVL4_9LACO|nr:heavy-metal-associated domain-containing protein [Lactiplantibacillus mudanjiangensis]VDG21288.1 copper resistance protein CopZ [Lactobacillus sp.] [Lactiplantibacillus mudanjiangensis]VDG22452.1 copper resistance protein CopZ [Lactobacillus sp.] [Lactiplantibacillus mudanjiangensis]VDG27018.1 copper resistance protein CopZ [Lactobacillus sp.] [Lactiplantibacillus mudanjiangensis]VDG32115.1 copper resistance protein CopZ [Lactobacillus sp.] [Lactiplantibacillus mudanjiangensis]